MKNKYFLPKQYNSINKNRTLLINFAKDFILYEQIKIYAQNYGVSMQSFVKGCCLHYLSGGKD